MSGNIHVVVTGAPGQSYATAEDAMEAWRAGKEFQVVGGGTVSIADIPHVGPITIEYVPT